MAISDAKRRADAKYHKKAYEQIKFISRREYRLSELIDLAAARRGISKASYIIGAIRDALARDGISLSDLPPAPGEDTPPRLPARTATATDGEAQEPGEQS